jgi:hypothetical protein
MLFMNIAYTPGTTGSLYLADVYSFFPKLNITGFATLIAFIASVPLLGETKPAFDLESYNVAWTTPSQNSSESMPCGGGDIGLNIWVEKGEVLIYLSRVGAFDENNLFSKLGRVRVKLTPNPLAGSSFRQELNLREGCVVIQGGDGETSANLKIWVDVFRPVVHIEAQSNKPVNLEATYETWRTQDHPWANDLELQASRGLLGLATKPVTLADVIDFDDNQVLWFHRNRDKTIFDLTVAMQKLDGVKSRMWNPLKGLTFGGRMAGQGMKADGTVKGRYASADFTGWKLRSERPARDHNVRVYLHVAATPTLEKWKEGLAAVVKESEQAEPTARAKTEAWWEQYWQRSYIAINPDRPDAASPEWQVGRNYNLMRYQLGCNARGEYPSKFNGGLFTFDPVFVDEKCAFPPDYRKWGGGTHTAQNQRLLYWPMLKSGDTDMMPSQLKFYTRALRNAELRSEVYWGIKGACFAEQIEQFGLPAAFEYGWNRPEGFPDGVDYNNWLEYTWDTAFEFCLMALDIERHTGEDISQYVPLVESCLSFFDSYYRKAALERSRKEFDGDGNLILYPGSAAETYKVAYNATSTIGALRTVLTRTLELPRGYLTEESRARWSEMLERIPPISFREMQGRKTIAPALAWARINNQEIPQLYPVFPWGLYGIGRPDLQVARDTWTYGIDEARQKNHISWHQDPIFCAQLGLTEEAAALTIKKLQDAPRRFPTFWGPGHDWVPDHNWGGSGMIGLQEMAMQTVGKKIYLLPAWPKTWDVDFKLHAPYQTTVTAKVRAGKVKELAVIPESRRADVIDCTAADWDPSKVAPTSSR